MLDCVSLDYSWKRKLFESLNEMETLVKEENKSLMKAEKMHSEVYWIFFFYFPPTLWMFQIEFIVRCEQKIKSLSTKNSYHSFPRFLLPWLAFFMFSQKIGKIFTLKLLNKFMVLHRQSRSSSCKKQNLKKGFSFHFRGIAWRKGMFTKRTKK